MGKFSDVLGTIGSQLQIGIGGTGLRRLRFKNAFTGDLEWVPTANRVITVPDASGTMALAGVGARVHHSIAQSIANTTNTPIAFNSERYDTDVIHDNSTNNSRLTCKTAGTYLIGGNVEFVANSTGFRQITILLNGSTTIAAHRTPSSSVTSIFSINTVYPLAINDYVQLVAYQDSGGSLNINSSANYSPEFYMQLLP